MKILGVDFPERQRPTCETCGEPMTLTDRLPNPKRGVGHEIKVFECYGCRREIRKAVAPDVKVNSLAE
jgi:hypothetical protein